MDNRDKLLNAMLDGYHVKEVEPEFLAQIMANATRHPAIQSQDPVVRPVWILRSSRSMTGFVQQAIAIAACAMFGFWMGHVELQPQQDDQLESLMMESTQLEEALL